MRASWPKPTLAVAAANAAVARAEAADAQADRRLPGRRPKNKLGPPRFGGAGVKDEWLQPD